MNLTPFDIRKQEFGKSLLGGCNQNKVEGFLGIVADEVEKLLRERAGLRDQVERLEASLKQYTNLEQTLQDTLTTAQKAMDDARTNAHQQAAMIVREGETKSKQLVSGAQKDAERISEDAQERADRTISEAQEEVRKIQEQIHRLVDMRDGFVVHVRSLFGAQMELIENLARVSVTAQDTPEDTDIEVGEDVELFVTEDDDITDTDPEDDGEYEVAPPPLDVEVVRPRIHTSDLANLLSTPVEHAA